MSFWRYFPWESSPDRTLASKRSCPFISKKMSPTSAKNKRLTIENGPCLVNLPMKIYNEPFSIVIHQTIVNYL